ncbi:hypothetical protein Nepgr_015076 [Nepenthes gracilis]|uniref:Uncharacterized protein n=1 Tax=Nepenthes gracilis TaxID=150966 RepID=A0AAD3SKF8_NEPGR|nr:hypothetical protein Nepgr_015076 [Nepenthes gracilis]
MGLQFKLLLRAAVNQKLFKGFTPSIAVREGQLEIIGVLLKVRASQHTCGEALLEARCHTRARCVEWLKNSDLIWPHVLVYALVTACYGGFKDMGDVFLSIIVCSFSQWLLPSEGGHLECEGIEKTWRIKQDSIAREVDILSSRNQYDIVLPELGPYVLDFTSSGHYMAVAGRKGHLAVVDMINMNLIKELQVRETVRDVVFLHNEMFFAAAQKK